EEPRPAEAAPPDDHAVAPRRAHHAQGVLRLPDVAVPEDGNGLHGLLEPGDRIPARLAVVELRRRPRVEPHGRAALLLADAAGIEVGEDLLVDPHAELDGDRD